MFSALKKKTNFFFNVLLQSLNFAFVCLILFYLLNSSICPNSLESVVALYGLLLFKYKEECEILQLIFFLL